MANVRHTAMLARGVAEWNAWRRKRPNTVPDLSELHRSDFERDVHSIEVAVANEVAPGNAPNLGGAWDGANLSGANLAGANLQGAQLDGAILVEADLSQARLGSASMAGCVLTGANLTGADAPDIDLTAATLQWADLRGAHLQHAVLRRCNLGGANAQRADLRGSDLFFANLVGSDLGRADLSGSLVFGVSAWDVELTRTRQKGLVITKAGDPTVTVDDLQIAQFLYLLIRNANVRAAIDSIATKVVLILGRFTPARMRILETVRQELTKLGYVPIIFDFDRPASRDFTETIATIAHLARLIIADLTEPASVPKELEAIVPDLAVPVVPLLAAGHEPYAMFGDYWKYDWVLPVVRYSRIGDLRRDFETAVVRPAETKARELVRRRAAAQRRPR